MIVKFESLMGSKFQCVLNVEKKDIIWINVKWKGRNCHLHSVLFVIKKGIYLKIANNQKMVFSIREEVVFIVVIISTKKLTVRFTTQKMIRNLSLISIIKKILNLNK